MTIYRGREVTGFAQDDTGVDVELSDGQSLRAHYLVGCDGGRSLVRKAAGIEFPGWDPTTSSLIAEVELAEEPEWGIRRDALGIHALGRVEYEIRDGEVVYADERAGTGHGDRRARRSHERAHPARSQRGADRRLRDRLRDPQSHWISRFTDMTRQAAAYRDRRVLLAGDAAHVHSPDGATGPQIGVQDAVNLGWKLAPGGQPDIARKASWIPTTPSVTRSRPACCAPRWRTSRSAPGRTHEALRDTDVPSS